MRQINIIPELNFWIKRELSNASVSVYDTYHKLPVDVDDSWREERSVIELLFNETFDPEVGSSSSSSSLESSNEKPYIYKYRRVNILNIEDKTLLGRIQPYRWWANIYAANSEKYTDLFNMQGSQLDPDRVQPNETFLPYDTPEEDRSPYITYQQWNASTSNYPLWQNSEEIIVENDVPAIVMVPDIFDFTDMTLTMLDKLWHYKTGCAWVHINDILYSQLDSCLAQLVYIYLDAFLNDSYTYVVGESSICDGTDILGASYEKHVTDMLYLLRQKMYGVIWKDSVVVSDRIHEINENFFIVTKKQVQRRRVSELILDNGEFTLEGTNLPWDRRDFTFFKDGLILEQDEDYTITVDVTDPTNVFVKVILLRDDFLINELVEFIYSYADPYSAFSEDDQ
jgi:hypothetical protein